MSLSRVKTWNRNEILLSTDLNAEFNNILQNGSTLVFPLSNDLDVGSKLLINTGLQNPSQLHNAILTMDKFSNSLPVAIASIGSTKTTLLIGSAITVGADATIPDNIMLWFVGPGKFFVNATYTLTINSPSQVLAHTQQQVFDGTGTVAFTNGGVVSPGWFGFSSGGTAATNQDAYQMCVASLPTGSGGVIIIPPTGTAHQVDDSLTHGARYVSVIGAHPDLSIIESTADASLKHGLIFSQSYHARNLTMKTSASLASNQTMKAINFDSPSESSQSFVCENLKITGFNIGIYADGGSGYKIDRGRVSNVDVTVTGPASSYVGSCLNMNRITQLDIDLFTVNQNACGDHAVYLFGCKNLKIHKGKIRGASTSQSQAIKIVGNGAGGSSAVYENWTVEDVDTDTCFNGVLVSTFGTEVLKNVRIATVSLKNITGEAGIPGAITVTTSDTSRIRNVAIDKSHMENLGYRGLHVSMASGAFVDQISWTNSTAYNWSTASSGTYSLFGQDSSGTNYHSHLENLTVDGNSNGRCILNTNSLATSCKRATYKNLIERNTTTPGFPITTSGQSGAGQDLNFAFGYTLYLNNASSCTYTTASNAVPGERYCVIGANANSVITDNATFNLTGGNWTSASGASLLLECLDSTPTFIEVIRGTT